MVQHTGFKKKILFIAVSAALLGGCADNSQYAGYGEYFELQERHFVERDLSAPYDDVTNQNVLRSNTIEMGEPMKDTEKKQKVIDNKTWKIGADEPYLVAAQRWLNKEGYKKTDWEIDRETNEALSARAKQKLTLNGTLQSAISQLGINIEHSLTLIVDKDKHIAGVHQFELGSSTVVLVHGTSMKDAIKNLVIEYGYVWGEDSSKSRSYLAHDDYRLGSSYPITTRKGDVSSALEKMLTGFPINAKILLSTKQVFIEGNK